MHVSHLDIVGHNAHSDTDNKSNVGLVCTGKTFFQPLWQSTHWKLLDTQWLLQAACVILHMAVDIWSSGWQVRKKILQLVKAYAYVEKCKNRHTWHTHEMLIFLSFGNSALTEKCQSEAK